MFCGEETVFPAVFNSYISGFVGSTSVILLSYFYPRLYYVTSGIVITWNVLQAIAAYKDIPVLRSSTDKGLIILRCSMYSIRFADFLFCSSLP